MHVVELDPGDPTLAEVLPVLRELRPHLDLELFRSIYHEGWPQGLRFTAVFDDADRCVAVAGWRIIASTSAVRKLYVDDLVTTSEARSAGHGHVLLNHLVRIAATNGCNDIDLDSGTHRVDAHRFYFREGLVISAFHFRRAIAAEPEEPLHPERLDPDQLAINLTAEPDRLEADGSAA
ncbi:MAG TPA: GNAT family N-acetyltransferase [Frankiaceae bacterium]|nr:GNAT family N-acetyltransferase [Frankiaceae bacterium]